MRTANCIIMTMVFTEHQLSKLFSNVLLQSLVFSMLNMVRRLSLCIIDNITFKVTF